MRPLSEFAAPSRGLGRARGAGFLGKVRGHAVERSVEGPGVSTAALLEGLGEQGYAIVHGVPTARGRLDYVVIGPTGAFAIQSEPWKGKVRVSSEPRLTVDGRDEHATVRQVRGAANDVATRLSRAGVVPWVQAVIVVSPKADLPRARMPIASERVTVVRGGDVAGFIREHSGRLSPQDVARAVDAFSGQPAHP